MVYQRKQLKGHHMRARSFLVCLMGPVIGLLLLISSGPLNLPFDLPRSEDIFWFVVWVLKGLFSFAGIVIGGVMPLAAAALFAANIVLLQKETSDPEVGPRSSVSLSTCLCGVVAFLSVFLGLMLCDLTLLRAFIVILVSAVALEVVWRKPPHWRAQTYRSLFVALPVFILLAQFVTTLMGSVGGREQDFAEISYTIGMSEEDMKDMDARLMAAIEDPLFGPGDVNRWLLGDALSTPNLAESAGTLKIPRTSLGLGEISCKRRGNEIEFGNFDGLSPSQERAFARLCVKRADEL